MDDRRNSIEAFIKSLSQNSDLDSGNNWDDGKGFNQKLLQARDLSEEALAHEVLKNTGIPIPSNNATLLRKEDFYNRMMEDLYPELDADVSFDPNMSKRNLGTYNPNNGKVELSPDVAKQDIRKGLSTAIRESAHKYDDKILKYNMPKNLITGKNADSQLNLEKSLHKFLEAETPPGPTALYEVAAKGHHARIPNLRDADSFGLGALKSMMKNGTFKALPFVGPALGAATALSTEDSMAAVPFLNEAESAGMSSGDEKQMLKEHDAKVNYDNSPAAKDRNQALRQQALQSLLKK